MTARNLHMTETRSDIHRYADDTARKFVNETTRSYYQRNGVVGRAHVESDNDWSGQGYIVVQIFKDDERVYLEEMTRILMWDQPSVQQELERIVDAFAAGLTLQKQAA